MMTKAEEEQSGGTRPQGVQSGVGSMKNPSRQPQCPPAYVNALYLFFEHVQTSQEAAFVAPSVVAKRRHLRKEAED